MDKLVHGLQAKGYVMPDIRRNNLEVSRQISEGKGDMVGERPNKVFLIIDGLGYNMVERFQKRQGFRMLFSEGERVERITTIFPSITPTVLPSLYSGLTPAEHGVLGMELHVKERGLPIHAFNGFPWEQYGVKDKTGLVRTDAGAIFPEAHLVKRAGERGKVASVQKIELKDSPSARHMMADSDPVFYSSLQEMLSTISRLVSEGEYRTIYAYYDGLDHAEHDYSPDSKKAEHELEDIILSIRRVLAPAIEDSGYNLVVTADHGQTTIRKAGIITLEKEFMKYLDKTPWCDSRVRIVSVVPGMEKDFEDYFSARYSNDAMLIRSDEAIEAGIFGKTSVDDSIRYRFGTHIILPDRGKMLMYEYPSFQQKDGPYHFAYDKEGNLKSRIGMHCGLTPDEMYIPVITI